MRNITVKNIRKSFGGRVVLSDVSFSFSEGRRLSIVGENGSGKSTLLKIMTGLIDYDAGEVQGLENGCAYIAQDFSGHEEETPYEFLARRVSSTSKAQRLLIQSGFDVGKDESRLTQVKCSDLSGGERKKLEIIAGIAGGASFIAMDEPENHLDYQTIQWLIDTLSKFHGGLLMVSHDHYFVDQLTDTVLELKDGSVTAYSMKYTEYLEEKARQIEGDARGWMEEKKRITRLRQAVEIMKLQAQRNSSRSSTYQQSKRRLKEREEKIGANPLAEQRKIRVGLSSVDQKKGKVIVSIEHLNFAHGTKQIFWDTSANLYFGEKVVLFGPNGSGKTTLVRLITGELVPQKGSVRIGVNIKYQFMTQNHLEGLDPSKSPLQIFDAVLGWSDNRCRARLAQYGIHTDLVNRPLGVLSGGQQARFKLALIFSQEPEFLILDEPTNHVDPPTWEAIVAAVKSYPGTVLAVTHDREFIDAIAEKLWVLKDRKILEELTLAEVS